MALRHVFLLVLLALMTVAAVPAGARAAELRIETMVIETESGRHSFATEIADTDPARARGLMFRRHLPADHAMLFIWGAPIEAAMWMKNTFIPLDMLFVVGDGRVVHVVANTTPHSLAVITAGQPVRAVIELAGGTAARLGIKTGSRVHHKFFGS
jgi:uncharacterized protein